MFRIARLHPLVGEEIFLAKSFYFAEVEVIPHS